MWYRRAEVLILQDGGPSPTGQSDSALTLLAEAVELAVPKGGVGLFMGYGDAIRHMLRKLEMRSRAQSTCWLYC